MKAQLLRVLFAGYLLCLFSTVAAQEVQFTAANQFYYNPYDDNNIGSVGYLNPLAKTIVLTSTTSTTFNNTIALTSVAGVNQKNNIYGSIIAPTLDRNLNDYDYEWTFLYKNNSSTSPIEPYDNGQRSGPANTGDAAWQYWLSASTYDQTSQTIQGFYMTQVGTNMILRYRNTQYDIQSLITFPITNNVVWSIKVQRLNTGKWSVWANPVSGSSNEATTYVGTSTQSNLNTYSYSILATTDLRTTGNNFYWDNLKLYTRRMSVTSVSSTSNGITQPSFYAGQTNVVTSGIQINTRGTYTIADINFGITPSGGTNINAFFTNGRLYKSIDDTYTTTSDNSLLATVNINSPTMQSASINSGSGDPNYSSGNSDGSLTRVADYFLVVDVLSSLNYGNPAPYNTYTQTGAVQIRTTDYTNPTYNGYTNNSTTGNNIVSFTNVAPPTASSVSRCGAGQVTLTASGGSPSGGTYKWYTAATGGTAVASTASYSPTITTTTTFYVTYTSGGSESPRTAVTATINPIVSSPVPNAAISYSFSGNTKDVSGNQNDGVLENAPTLTTDRYGFANSAYSFNGSTQWMSSTTQIAGPQTFTISMWFNTTTTSGGKLISFSDGQNVSASGGYDRHLYMTNSGQLIFGVYNGGTRTVTSASSYNDGNWHHVVVTFGATSGIVMYVDNNSVGSLAYYAAETRNGYWKIGFDDLGGSWPSIPTSKYFNGSIDDVAIYNTELTSSAVSALNDVNQIGSYTPVCAGSPISIYAPTITGATYNWTSPSGTTYQGNPGVFSSASAGNYTLTVTGGPGSCSSTATYTPTVTSLPGSVFTATSPVTVVTGTSTVTLTSTYDATATYTWSFDSGTATGSTQAGYSVSWLTSGTKTISLTVTKGSCSSTTTQTVVVGLAGPTVSGTTLCGAGSTTLTVTGAIAGVTYNWYIDNTTTTALQSSTSASYTPFVGGTTTFYVSATSGTTTTLRTAVTVTVNPKASSSINSPMLSYPFESGSLTDWSGLSNNGTLQGTTLPTTVADRNGLANGAYSFSGTNASPQYISTTTQYVPLIFSYSIWFKTTVAGGKLIGIGGNQTGSNATQDRNLYMNDAGLLYYGVYNGGTVTINTTTAYNDGLWHHVIVTDGPTNGMRIYVDGTQQASTATYTVPQQINEFWRIGGDNLQGWPSRPSNDYFVGILDDVAIYNHELSASEITSNDMNLYKFSAGYCANNPLTITAQTMPGTPTYSWVDNATPSITGSGNPATFSKATTTNYTLTTTVNGCTQNTAIVTPTLQTYTWTGLAGTTAVGTDNNWTNTSTGIAGQAPKLDGTEAIIIGVATTNFYPVLTANKSAYTLTVNNGAKLDLGGFTLNVGCNIFNSAGGTLTMGTGTNFNASGITWNGVSPNTNQSFTGSSTASTSQLGNMTVSNTVTGGNVTITAGKLDLYNVLTMTSGNLIVSSPATVTLKSLATQSATVAAIPSGLTITGNFSVERYIAGGTSKRGYRLLTSPVNNGSGIYTVNYFKNNAYVTGTTTTSGGFDLSPNANNPTIYFFRENLASSNTSFTSGNYRGLNNLNSAPNYAFDGESGTFTLPVGNGFLFFFRGDRSVASIAAETVASYVPTGTTFTTTGTLNTGNITVKHWYSQASTLMYSTTTGSKVSGYNLVGNPYASTINIEKFNRQSVQAKSSIYGGGFPDESGATLSSPLKIWVFNPVTKQYSTYEQKKTAIASADTVSNVNPGISSDGFASNMIATGQGFFVRATATGQTLTFRESAKTNTQPNTGSLNAILSTPDRPVLASTSKLASFATMQPQAVNESDAEPRLRFRLIKDSVNVDAVVLALDKDISPLFNKEKDAEDLGGSGALVSLSIFSADSLKATIHRRPFPHKQQEVIPLFADATASGPYQLKLSDLTDLPDIYEVWLKDALTKDSLDIKNNRTYNFNIDKGNAASFGKDRFSIVLRQDPALALKLIDFTAVKVIAAAKVTWTVKNEANYTTFVVQKSTDNGTTWQNIDVIQSNSAGSYNYTDVNPVKGLNKYRLQLTDLNNDISFSKDVSLMYANISNTIANNWLSVYPNPTAESINIRISQPNASSNYNIEITNSSGIILKSVNITELYWKNNVSSFVPGTYIVKVINNKTKQLVGVSKFVKL
ncbi:LamG-like jellyroll fold domain-containing protein [Mucilaginibacter rubeus]|uniref:T9SS type A sorting domain-containing protein n=1 Tax=Mucilaginibacter rubeus TaxID=2027860 RepID=A0A5C1HZP1_9SPHI|nr:LamG-like jellyroll fold domain-containing protein [Mucilaginibacter rubeus]QEM11103.1 T9SS type A sorting domain-containing protein [Mucilaginibacter rubeus]